MKTDAQKLKLAMATLELLLPFAPPEGPQRSKIDRAWATLTDPRVSCSSSLTPLQWLRFVHGEDGDLATKLDARTMVATGGIPLVLCMAFLGLYQLDCYYGHSVSEIREECGHRNISAATLQALEKRGLTLACHETPGWWRITFAGILQAKEIEVELRALIKKLTKDKA